jgi:hypothetical protein
MIFLKITFNLEERFEWMLFFLQKIVQRNSTRKIPMHPKDQPYESNGAHKKIPIMNLTKFI